MLSWRGKYGNLTYAQLIDQVYTDDDDTDIQFINENNVIMENVFIQPNGFCTKMTDFDVDQELQLTSNSNLKFFIVDPLMDNPIWIEKHAFSGDTIESIRIHYTGEDDLYEMKAYTVKVYIEDHSLQKGIACTEYESQNCNYEDCVINEFKKHLEPRLGCLPEWIPSQNVCTEPVAVDDQTFKDFGLVTSQIINGRSVSMLSACLPPCIQVKIISVGLLHAITS